MTYAEFLARPSSVNDAECLLLLYPKAGIRYGDWDTDHEYGQFIPSGKPWKTHSIDAVPVPAFTTDRNATAMLVGEVKRRGRDVRFTELFDIIAASSGIETYADILTAAPSLVAWACCESCRGGAS